MYFLFPSPVTVVKSHEKKNVKTILVWLESLRYGKMIQKYEFWRSILILQEEKIMDFDYCEEYLGSISNKILLWQVSENQILIQLSFADW